MTTRSNEPRSDQKKSKKETPVVDVKRIIVLRLQSKSKSEPDQIFKFDKERIVLGSVVSADVRLTGEGISPIHAVLEMSSGQGVVFDLASISGVFVNDKKIVTQELKNTDMITIGRHRLRFNLDHVATSSFSDQKVDRTRETEGRVLFLDPKEDLRPLLLQDEREIEEIFDFRPTSKRALEVVMSWCGSILDVEHFVHEKKILIGNTRKSNFGIPPLLSSSEYPIVTQTRDGAFVLNLDTQMKGVVQQGGSLVTVEGIRNQAKHGPNGYEVPIGNNDFAKIEIGDIDFYFSFTAAPPRLKRRRLFEKDPFFTKVFSSSVVLTLLTLGGLSQMKLPQSIEAEQVPERIATILYQPEKFIKQPPPPEKPKPIPEAKPTTPPPKEIVKVDLDQKIAPKKPVSKPVKPQVQPKKPAPAPVAQNKPAPKAAAKEGEGARAKGPEGTRGEKNKPAAPVHSTEIKRPPVAVANEDGNVNLLRGAGGRIQNILGASSANLGAVGDKAKGFGNFTSSGSGGLALSGTGQGGGGSAETTLGGLSNKGTGMGRIGTGMGAAGNSTGIVGAYARVDIRTDGPGEQVVMGDLNWGEVNDWINAHKDEVRLCYDRELNAENPSLSGKVVVRFEIGSSGRVTHAGIDSSSLHNSNAENCVLKVIRRIQISARPSGVSGIMTKTFDFAAVKKY